MSAGGLKETHYTFKTELSLSGSTREMVEIMQENGEVVATLGSSANHHNIRIFLASDASLAVEPLYPQVKIGKTQIRCLF